jgi:hypothetical protein
MQEAAQRLLARDYFTRAYDLLKHDPGVSADELDKMKRLADGAGK